MMHQAETVALHRCSQHGGEAGNPTSQNAKIGMDGGDTVSTEAVASRRHAGGQPPATGWKLELPTITWHLLLN